MRKHTEDNHQKQFTIGSELRILAQYQYNLKFKSTLGPRTTLLLGHQKCSVVQKSAIQGYCYVVIVLYKKISAMQGQYYIVRVLKTSAMQVKIEYVLK